jgi:hypothetical protein
MGAATGAVEAHQLFGKSLDPDSVAATICAVIFPTLPADCRENMRLEIADMIEPVCKPEPPEYQN